MRRIIMKAIEALMQEDGTIAPPVYPTGGAWRGR